MNQILKESTYAKDKKVNLDLITSVKYHINYV